VPALGVPHPYREPLTKLAGLSDDKASELVAAIAALDRFAPVSLIEVASAAILDDGGSVWEKQLALPLLALRGQLRKMTPEEIAERLSESGDLDLDEAARSRFRARAAAILGTPVFGSTGVATDLQTLNERNYQSARIVTDLRPVFGDDVTVAPGGAVIVETLQIQTWGRDGGSQLLFVSMDEFDLRALQSIVERALDKTETLKTFIAEKGLSYFELEKEGAEG
jgi:hypothetical protein